MTTEPSTLFHSLQVGFTAGVTGGVTGGLTERGVVTDGATAECVERRLFPVTSQCSAIFELELQHVPFTNGRSQGGASSFAEVSADVASQVAGDADDVTPLSLELILSNCRLSCPLSSELESFSGTTGGAGAAAGGQSSGLLLEDVLLLLLLRIVGVVMDFVSSRLSPLVLLLSSWSIMDVSRLSLLFSIGSGLLCDKSDFLLLEADSIFRVQLMVDEVWATAAGGAVVTGAQDGAVK